MANSFDQMNYFKEKTLVEVAKRCYEGTISKESAEEIAQELIPYSHPRVMGYTPKGHDLVPGQFVYVLEAACDDCNIHRVRITDNCRKCLFKACVNACKFNAINEGDSKMHIQYDKCKACTMCAKACPSGFRHCKACHKFRSWWNK